MLELQNIYKNYYIDKKPFSALKDISLFFPKHEFCAILGPSGCGKTTTLNIIGGLDRYTSGDLIIEGISTKTYTDKDWDNYRNKRIGFVFQNYNLVPHISILANVELAMTLQGISKKERDQRAKESLNKVGLEGIYNKKPNQLSGGQMQRVAIARALVNDPDIILADEPTGALDSVTSIQIMDILKEISKNKLVIMVTHNESLAKDYADRIITFKDGIVENDSKHGEIELRKIENEQSKKINKLEIIDEKDKKNKKKRKKDKTSMDLWTAIKLSLTNINSKRGRTILTSIASSFGIIGVALVLAMNNGFTQYIGRMETETASSLPITLPSYTVTYKKSNDEDYNKNTKFPEENEIYPYISNQNLTSREYRYNNFSDKYFRFLEKLRDEDKLINDYIVNYSSGYQYHLVTEFPESIDGESESIISDVDTSYTTNTFNSVMGSVTGLPTTIFHTLYGQEEYIMKNYDLIEGKYPTKSNELVLVVDQYNRISFSTLRTIGFYNSEDTYEDVIVSIKDNDGEETSNKTVKGITFEDIKKKSYKIFSHDEFYKRKDIANNKGHEYIPYMGNSLKELYESQDIGEELKIVGILRPNENISVSLMPEGLCFIPSFQDELIQKNSETYFLNNALSNITFKENKTRADFINELMNIVNGDASLSSSSLSKMAEEYFDIYALIKTNLTSENPEITTMTKFINNSKKFAIGLVPDSLKKLVLSTDGGDSLDGLLSYIVKMIIGSTSDQEFIASFVGLLAYFESYSDIANVVVFPKDLTSKQELLSALDEYNNIDNSEGKDDKYHANSESEQIYYSDIASSVTDMMGEMINIISIVLIIFASISLVVSSVMTGIITYAGVIERTKEIGILRAIGARKKDVGRMFQSECLIIGCLAGIIGCLIAYLVCFPINIAINIVYAQYNVGNIADLSILSTIVLILISMVLTFVSGFIPARIAAKKDPVVALRSE